MMLFKKTRCTHVDNIAVNNPHLNGEATKIKKPAGMRNNTGRNAIRTISLLLQKNYCLCYCRGIIIHNKHGECRILKFAFHIDGHSNNKVCIIPDKTD